MKTSPKRMMKCSIIKSTLGNQDITYAARRLQSLHNFAETNFGLTKVTIEQAESKLKVRAQLLSVHQYLAFLEQLTLNTQGLDGMMVRVFYILAFRTGMRKKELLGLKFSDIELLSSPHPSLLIRPNEHRSIKLRGQFGGCRFLRFWHKRSSILWVIFLSWVNPINWIS